MTIKHKKVKVYQVIYVLKQEFDINLIPKEVFDLYKFVTQDRREDFLDFKYNRDGSLEFIIKDKETVQNFVEDWVWDFEHFRDIWNFKKTIEVERTVIQDLEDDYNEDILLPSHFNIEDFRR